MEFTKDELKYMEGVVRSVAIDCNSFKAMELTVKINKLLKLTDSDNVKKKLYQVNVTLIYKDKVEAQPLELVYGYSYEKVRIFMENYFEASHRKNEDYVGIECEINEALEAE